MFRRSLALWLAIASALLMPVSLAAQAAWSVFTSAEGGFSVSMPIVPTESVEQITTGPGSPGKSVVYTAVVDNEIYLAGWAQYDPNFDLDIEGELRANRDNFVNGVGATLTESKPITIGKRNGLEFTGSSTTMFVKGRVIMVGKKPYLAVAVVPPSRSATPNLDIFFKSWKLPK